MKRQRRSAPLHDVLCYRPTRTSRATVRRYYVRWRREHGIPPRCDMEGCIFHIEPLIWRGKALPVILDHANGNSLDNSPKNLRYLCPNCDAQLLTRGGLNRGRVLEAGEGKYVLVDRDGKRHFHLIAEAGHLKLTGHAPVVIVSPIPNKA